MPWGAYKESTEKCTLHNTANVFALSAKSRHDHMQSVTIPSCGEIFQFIVHPMFFHLCLFPVFSEFFLFYFFFVLLLLTSSWLHLLHMSHLYFSTWPALFHLGPILYPLFFRPPQKISCFNTNDIKPGNDCLFKL